MQDTTSYYTVDYKNMFISALVTFILHLQSHINVVQSCKIWEYNLITFQKKKKNMREDRRK